MGRRIKRDVTKGGGVSAHLFPNGDSKTKTKVTRIKNNLFLAHFNLYFLT